MIFVALTTQATTRRIPHFVHGNHIELNLEYNEIGAWINGAIRAGAVHILMRLLNTLEKEELTKKRASAGKLGTIGGFDSPEKLDRSRGSDGAYGLFEGHPEGVGVYLLETYSALSSPSRTSKVICWIKMKQNIRSRLHMWVPASTSGRGMDVGCGEEHSSFGKSIPWTGARCDKSALPLRVGGSPWRRPYSGWGPGI